MTPTQKFSYARSSLLMDYPFFGQLALRMSVVERDDLNPPTMATDGKNIYYHPQFVANSTVRKCIMVVAHEVMHCVLHHIFRRDGRDPKRWAIACDFALNPILKESGFDIDDGLYNPAWAGKSAEEIYTLLPESLGSGSGSGSGSDPGQGQGQEPFDMLLQPTSEEAAAESEVEWTLAIIQSAKVAKTMGKLPGSLEKLLQDALTPKVPWRDVLANFMTERVRDDYSWRRPNPRYMHSGFYMPSMDGVGMGEMAIFLDTSGSVLSVLNEFGSTVKDVVNTVRPTRVHVIYCDAEVNKVEVFEQHQPLEFRAVGGGGTDFRPPFKYLEEHGIRPACALYLTDMYGTFPEKAPEYPTLWCATTDTKGPFGETIQIKE